MSAHKMLTGWIVFKPFDTGVDSILGYICSCKVGNRTGGMCAHLCSVMWFLGYARHRSFSPRCYQLADSILNAVDLIAARCHDDESDPGM